MTISSVIEEIENVFKTKYNAEKWGEEFRPGHTEAEQVVWAAVEKALAKELTRGELFAITFAEFGLNQVQLADWKNEVLVQADRVAQGEPLAHVLGFRFFNGHRYTITPDVLTPRPETEGLLEKTFERLGRLGQRSSLKGLEIGLGSGVLSIELLLQYSTLRMTATEVSASAILVAHQNAAKFGVDDRLDVVQARLDQEIFSSLASDITYDFIISNPPYLEMDVDVSALVWNTEPQIALAALANPYLASQNNDSLYFYRELARKGIQKLVAGGLIALEVPDLRAEVIRGFFDQAGWAQIELQKDLTGRP